MVQLKEFVRSTLVQIAEGVKQAQDDVTKVNARVNPVRDVAELGPHRDNEFGGNFTRLAEFDVAVEAIEETSSRGGLGVIVAAIGFGVQHKAGESTSAASRVKFTVPILLPPGR